MLQYNILNNLIITKSKLKIMKIQNDDICNFCKESKQTLVHILLECKKTKPFLANNLKNNLSNMNEDAQIDDKYFVLLLTYQDTKQYKQLNKLLLWTRQFIIKQINLSEALNHNMYKQYIKTNLQYEYAIAKRNGTIDKHKDKWKSIITIS